LGHTRGADSPPHRDLNDEWSANSGIIIPGAQVGNAIELLRIFGGSHRCRGYQYCYMLFLMYILRRLKGTQLGLGILLIFGFLVPPLIASQPADQPRQVLRVQTTTFPDVDGDQILDRATVTGTGADKSISVYISHDHSSSVLSFSSSSSGSGSLLASDVDQDGDVDLVWTDLVDPGEVVVWLNDGLGRFERAPSAQFAAAFVIGGNGLGENSPAERQNPAANSHRVSLYNGAIAHGHAQFRGMTYFSDWRACDQTLPSTLLDPERGPPAILI